MAETPFFTHQLHFDEEWSWCCDFDTRDEAVAEAADCLGLAPGDTFKTAQVIAEDHVPELPVTALALIEGLQDDAYSEMSEGAVERLGDALLPLADELDAALRAAWDAVIAKHGVKVTLYRAVDEEDHVAVGEGDEEARELAADEEHEAELAAAIAAHNEAIRAGDPRAIAETWDQADILYNETGGPGGGHDP